MTTAEEYDSRALKLLCFQGERIKVLDQGTEPSDSNSGLMSLVNALNI